MNWRWHEEQAPIDSKHRLRVVERFAALMVTVLEGDGEDTVMREVSHIFDETGVHIAQLDPFPGGREPRRPEMESLDLGHGVSLVNSDQGIAFVIDGTVRVHATADELLPLIGVRR
jgi:hypothetical protein